MYNLEEIAYHFQIRGRFISAAPYGNGHINETFASQFQEAQNTKRYIHQRINHNVFTKPEIVMGNICRITEFLHSSILQGGGNPQRRTLTLIPTLEGDYLYHANNETYWRTYEMIEGASTYDLPSHPNQVKEAARAFGKFQKILSNLPGKRLYETIPDFHNTPKRFQVFQQSLVSDTYNRTSTVQKEIDFILARQKDTELVVEGLRSKDIPERVTHNDTKLNNVLIDDISGEGICVIDLDTTMPGSILYDFGDMVRSCAATAAEDEIDLSKVGIDLEMYNHLVQGYLESASSFLVEAEWDLLAFSGKLITLEQAIRFLTDYLNGDTYYKINYPLHNLDRARNQIQMVTGIERNMEAMKKLIKKYRNPS